MKKIYDKLLFDFKEMWCVGFYIGMLILGMDLHNLSPIKKMSNICLILTPYGGIGGWHCRALCDTKGKTRTT